MTPQAETITVPPELAPVVRRLLSRWIEVEERGGKIGITAHVPPRRPGRTLKVETSCTTEEPTVVTSGA